MTAGRSPCERATPATRPGPTGRMLGLGLRLVVSGGREALVRLEVLAVAVGRGVGLLLIAVAGINAVNAQNDRLDTVGSPQSWRCWPRC
jgi:hypothetical protein